MAAGGAVGRSGVGAVERNAGEAGSGGAGWPRRRAAASSCSWQPAQPLRGRRPPVRPLRVPRPRGARRRVPPPRAPARGPSRPAPRSAASRACASAARASASRARPRRPVPRPSARRPRARPSRAPPPRGRRTRRPALGAGLELGGAALQHLRPLLISAVRRSSSSAFASARCSCAASGRPAPRALSPAASDPVGHVGDGLGGAKIDGARGRGPPAGGRERKERDHDQPGDCSRWPRRSRSTAADRARSPRSGPPPARREPDGWVRLALEGAEHGQSLLEHRTGADRALIRRQREQLLAPRGGSPRQLALEARRPLRDDGVGERVCELRRANRGGVLDGDVDDVARSDGVSVQRRV